LLIDFVNEFSGTFLALMKLCLGSKMMNIEVILENWRFKCAYKGWFETFRHAGLDPASRRPENAGFRLSPE